MKHLITTGILLLTCTILEAGPRSHLRRCNTQMCQPQAQCCQPPQNCSHAPTPYAGEHSGAHILAYPNCVCAVYASAYFPGGAYYYAIKCSTNTACGLSGNFPNPAGCNGTGGQPCPAHCVNAARFAIRGGGFHHHHDRLRLDQKAGPNADIDLPGSGANFPETPDGVTRRYTDLLRGGPKRVIKFDNGGTPLFAKLHIVQVERRDNNRWKIDAQFPIALECTEPNGMGNEPTEIPVTSVSKTGDNVAEVTIGNITYQLITHAPIQ